METFDLPSLEAAGPVFGARATEEMLAAERAAALDRAIADGRAEGFQAGRREALEQLAPIAAALGAAVAGVDAERERTSAAVEQAAVELAVRIAEQILRGQLDAEPEIVVDVVRGALRRLVDRERVSVLVNPDDLDLMREAVPELIAELGGIDHCEVQAERRVERGGAIVRTTEGEIDATVQTKLDRVREVLADGAHEGA